jgi:glycosyltransferase involved in cell wall biosynthesis
MRATALAYAAVTPARNEEENLRRLAAALAAQTAPPAEWVVVDDGSSDGTASLVGALAAEHPWARLLSHAGVGGRSEPGSPTVRAFHAGVAALQADVDVVVKVDADVSFEPDHFERLLAAFAADERLGIAGSDCWEQEPGGEWRAIATGGHVRGAVRAYRRGCLDAVLPLEEGMAWDGVDVLKAELRGWTARVVPGLGFRHHRRVGERDGARQNRWIAQGRGAWTMGYRPGYLLLRTAFRARHDPYAVFMLSGYAGAALRRAPRIADAGVLRELRRRQSLRRLPLRARGLLARGEQASQRP